MGNNLTMHYILYYGNSDNSHYYLTLPTVIVRGGLNCWEGFEIFRAIWENFSEISKKIVRVS